MCSHRSRCCPPYVRRDLVARQCRLELAARHREPVGAFVRPARPSCCRSTWGDASAASAPPLALGCVLALPKASRIRNQRGERPSFVGPIHACARFVVAPRASRGIVLCAVLLDFAFVALLAVWAPLALGPLARSGTLARPVATARPDPGRAVAPSWRGAFRRWPILIFGPACQ